MIIEILKSLPSETLAAAGSAAGGVLAFLLGRGYQRYQEFEAANRSELSLEIESSNRNVIVRRHNGRWVCVETEIAVKNIARRSCCILALYTWSKPHDEPGLCPGLVDSSDPRIAAMNKLREIHNLAIMEGSIIQLGPEESETFLRRDYVPAATAVDMTLWTTEILVFAAEYSILGESIFGPSKIGKLRKKWIDYMKSDSKEVPTHVRFGRWKPENGSELKAYSRYLVRTDGQPDLVETARFKKVLGAMTLWERSLLLNTAETNLAHEGNRQSKGKGANARQEVIVRNEETNLPGTQRKGSKK